VRSFVNYVYFLQLASYSAAIALFCWHFETVSKVASIQILMRFLQVTIMIAFYELSWQGGHIKIFCGYTPGTYMDLVCKGQTGGYRQDVFAMEWASVFTATSFVMPAMLFPAVRETAALECQTDNPGLSVWSTVVVLGLPVLILSIRWLLWLRVFRPQYSASGLFSYVATAWDGHGSQMVVSDSKAAKGHPGAPGKCQRMIGFKVRRLSFAVFIVFAASDSCLQIAGA
jgi:hypothetical protein